MDYRDTSRRYHKHYKHVDVLAFPLSFAHPSTSRLRTMRLGIGPGRKLQIARYAEINCVWNLLLLERRGPKRSLCHRRSDIDKASRRKTPYCLDAVYG
jgi:hypothetical protein